MAIISNMSIWFLLVVLCSWVIVGYCQGGGDLPCVQSLMPCQPYLKGAVAPPASCCVPLKQIVATEVQCLCAVFNNQAIMKSLNVTQADALNLVKSCGSSADTSLCNTAATPPSPPSTPSASSNSSTTNPPPPHKKNAASTISHVGIMATILSFIVSTFYK